MSEQIAHEPRIPERELNKFAGILYGYLYFKLKMFHCIPSFGPHFKEEIGKAVLRVRNYTREFNSTFLDKCGYFISKNVICQEICDLYPNLDYFKKLFFVSAFILELAYWHNEDALMIDFSLGPHLWLMIFRKNFESEFVSRGGWQGLVQAATDFQEMPLNEILPREYFLPATLEGVMARINVLNANPEQAAVDEATASLKSLQVGQMEIDDASVVAVAQSKEGIEKSHPRKLVQVEESKEEGQPEAMDDRSVPPSSALGGNVAQTEYLGASTSGISGEGGQHSFGRRNLRKRRVDTPPQSDSDEETDSVSPSKAKAGKK